MNNSFIEESRFRNSANDIPYQRTSTAIAPTYPAVPNLETAYDGWVKQLNRTPTDVKVRGTNRILTGIVAGMVSKGPTYPGKHQELMTTAPLYSWYDMQQFHQVPLTEKDGQCNCENCQ